MSTDPRVQRIQQALHKLNSGQESVVITTRPPDLDDEPAEYLNCPFCRHTVQVSEFDPAASFTEMLDHIGLQHPRADMSPSKLWPRIKVTND